MKNKEISKKIYNQRVINKINNKIKLLGISSKLTTEKFLIIRLITTIIIFLFILINYKYGYILSIIVSIIYYFLLEKIVLDSKIKKRRKKLDIEAIKKEIIAKRNALPPTEKKAMKEKLEAAGLPTAYKNVSDVEILNKVLAMFD